MTAARFTDAIGLADFLALPHAITLLGMSGVGKTRLATHLRKSRDWFHYSADYRIGTQYLAKSITDEIKQRMIASGDPVMIDLLRSDSIYIAHNITIDNLDAVSSYLGMFGDPDSKDPANRGLPREAFLSRQQQYCDAEIRSMHEVPEFLRAAWRVYGYWNFVNDAAGSLCEVVRSDDPREPLLEILAHDTAILYLAASDAMTDQLIKRSKVSPKPLYYPRNFIKERLDPMPADGKGVDAMDFAAGLIEPLILSRRPKYAAIAANFGFTVDSAALPGAFDVSLDADGIVTNVQEKAPDRFAHEVLVLFYDVLMRSSGEADHLADRALAYVERCRQRAAQRGR